MKNTQDKPNNNERRRFLNISSKYGFTAALVAAASGSLLVSEEASAATGKEERSREKAAKYKMTIATAYVLGATRSYPIMQLDFKENIQNMTRGQIYVKLAPGGQLGAGGALVQKVQQGTIQAAQHSLSNFAPFASAIDLINLPYFCGANQNFVNLVNSDTWRNTVHPLVEAKGFKPLWYTVIDPRVVALRKGQDGPIKTPDDMAGLKFRVPGSKMLQQYYRAIGANPTPVAWGETPSAIKQGVADALDPSVGALNVFGFTDNSMVLRLGAFDDDDISAGIPGLSGHTLINMSDSGNGPSTVSGGSGYVLQATSGDSGSSNFSLTATEEYVTVTLSISPAP